MTDYTRKNQHTVMNLGFKAHQYGFNPGSSSGFDHSSSGSPFTSSTVFDSRSGSDQPRWRDIIRSGGNATTSFTGIAYSEPIDSWVSATYEGHWFDSLNRPGYLRYEYDGTILSCDHPIQASASGTVVADVRNRCIRRFLDAIDSAQSSFEAGQDLGEYKETLHSIQKPLYPLRQKILSYLQDVKKRSKGYRGKPAGLAKTISDTYLEWHFGWQPLVDDVASAIADCGRFRFSSIPVSAYASSHYQGNVHSSSTGLPFSSTGVNQHYRDTSVYSARYKGAVRVKNLSQDGRISWAQSLQLTPDKWLPTAWDLLPYSWMADYFVNIGQIIRGLSAMTADLSWGCITTRDQTTRTYFDYTWGDPVKFGITAPSNLQAFGSIFGGTGDMWVRTVSRSPLTPGSLVPSLQFSVPTSKYAFANMGAVLIQRGSAVTKFLKTLF